MQYLVKYKLFFHAFNKEGKVQSRLTMACLILTEKETGVYNEAGAVDYVKGAHKLGEIEKLFKVPQEIYDSEYGEVGATSLKILRCWTG